MSAGMQPLFANTAQPFTNQVLIFGTNFGGGAITTWPDGALFGNAVGSDIDDFAVVFGKGAVTFTGNTITVPIVQF